LQHGDEFDQASARRVEDASIGKSTTIATGDISPGAFRPAADSESQPQSARPGFGGRARLAGPPMRFLACRSLHRPKAKDVTERLSVVQEAKMLA